MRKWFPLLLASVLLLALSACSNPSATTPSSSVASTSNPASSTKSAQNQAEDAALAKILNSKTIAAVYRTQDLVGYQQYLEKTCRKYIPDFSIKKFVLVDSLNDALLQLNSGRVDVVEIMDFTGKYLAQRNNSLNFFDYQQTSSSTHMLFSQKKKAEFEKVNQALKSMLDDGTVAKLIDRWITSFPAGEEPSKSQRLELVDAYTITMGVSGDEPPLDYVAADGNPIGFNTEVLAEISLRAGLNIRIIPVTGSGRFAALESAKIDAFLWHNAFIWSNHPAPTSMVVLGQQKLWITVPYLQAGGAYVYKK